MIERNCKRISDYLCRNNIIPAKDAEIYQYGFSLIFTTIINCISTVVIGLILRMVVESILLLLFFAPIRRYAGGFHMRTRLQCFFISMAWIITGLLLSKCLYDTYMLNAIAAVVLGILIVLFSPVEDENKPLNSREKSKYKKIAVFLYIMEMGVNCICIVMGIKMVASVAASAFLLLNGIIILGIIRNRVRVRR